MKFKLPQAASVIIPPAKYKAEREKSRRQYFITWKFFESQSHMGHQKLSPNPSQINGIQLLYKTDIWKKKF